MIQVSAVPDFGGGFVVNVDIGALETVNGLFRVAHHKDGMVFILQENFPENVPLQLVRVLEFVDDGVIVLGAQFLAEPASFGFLAAFAVRIFGKYGCVYR